MVEDGERKRLSHRIGWIRAGLSWAFVLTLFVVAGIYRSIGLGGLASIVATLVTAGVIGGLLYPRVQKRLPRVLPGWNEPLRGPGGRGDN